MASAAGGAQTTSFESCPPSAQTSVAPSTSSPPGPLQPTARQILACVGSQSITGPLFRHWVGVAKRAEGKRAKTRVLVDEVMSFLISSDWVIGEARDLNVQVSAVEVRHRFARIRPH